MEHINLKKHEGREKQAIIMLGLFVLATMPSIAMADSGSGIFCWIANYLKQIVGAAALVAIGLWAIEHIFGASKLHDMVIRVGIACGIVVIGATLIANSGLTVNC